MPILPPNSSVKFFLYRKHARYSIFLRPASNRKAFVLYLLFFIAFSSLHAVSVSSTSTGGAWNSGGTWVGGNVPAGTDDVIIASGATVTTGGNRSCNHLTINGTLTVANGNILTVTGDFTNNGTFNPGGTSATVNFSGNNALQTVSGNATAFNRIDVNKGSSYNNILNITCVITMASNGLDVFNGTFKLSSASTITPFTGNPNLTSTAGFWNNGGNITCTNGNNFSFAGLFRHTAGTCNIGNSSNDFMRYASGSTMIMEGGTVNIAGAFRPDAAATSTITYNQSGGTFVCGINGTNSSAVGVFDIGHTGSSFTMSGGSIVIVRSNANFSGGDYEVLAGTTSVTGGTIQIGNATTPASQSILINTTAPIYNLTVNSTNSPTATVMNNDITVKNTLTIMTGATFDPANFDITVTGNWVNSGSYSTGTSSVVLNGTGSHVINGTTTFYNLLVNTSGSVTLNSSITVSNQLSFTRGILTGSSANMVIFADNAAVSGASDSGHVHGAVRKIGNDAFTFPVGNGTYYAPIGISAPANTNQEFTAQYIYSAYSNTTSLSGLNRVSGKEYWTLDRSGNTNSVNVTLSFSDNRGSGVNASALSDLRVARWNGSQWVSHGNGGSSYSAPDGTVVTSAAVSSFSPFTLGSSGGLSVLPVQWLYVKAESRNNNMLVSWSVSEEVNVSHYEVEKSLDGKQWSPIGEVKANYQAGSATDYRFADPDPVGDWQYYRIKETDLDGSISVSPIAAAYYTRNIYSMYPNPVSGMYVYLDLKETDIEKICIYNAAGGELMRIQVEYPGDRQSIDVSSLPAGLYLVELKGKGDSAQWINFYKQ